MSYRTDLQIRGNDSLCPIVWFDPSEVVFPGTIIYLLERNRVVSEWINPEKHLLIHNPIENRIMVASIDDTSPYRGLIRAFIQIPDTVPYVLGVTVSSLITSLPEYDLYCNAQPKNTDS